MQTIHKKIQTLLQENIDEKTRDSSQRFFKETVRSYGVKTAIVRKISREIWRELKQTSKQEVFDLCELLWQSGYLEEDFVACHLSHAVRKDYEKDDFELFVRWLDSYISNWASCDTFCNHTIGDFLIAFPEYVQRLKDLAKSDNRWVRRGSAVSLIVPARRGLFLDDIFDIATILLLDKDDLVQKGYGWMLKVASETYQDEVFDFVVKNKKIMPRISLRYAIEKMPKQMKTIAMAK